MEAEVVPHDDNSSSSSRELIPAFESTSSLSSRDIRNRLTEACSGWLARSPSPNTRSNYTRDLEQFFAFLGFSPHEPERLTTVRPHHVAAWRDHLRAQGLTNSSIRRKLTALRSLFSYLKTYGYLGANPAHSDFVDAPAVPRDGKTVGMTATDCRRLLDAPDPSTPVGIRDRAILALLAYSACRVGEVAALSIRDYLTTGGYKIIEVYGKGGKERRVPLHPEAVDRLESWLDTSGLRDAPDGPLFRPAWTARGAGREGFRPTRLTRRSIQYLVKRYCLALGLDPAVTVHSFRVTALTTAREQGVDIIDLQDFAGHADPRTTLTYIRSRDRLSKSPAYVLRY
ncbi:MAG: tyrosine-type recombinase/integrase [Planctomycetaceae bacterium]